MVNEHNVNYGIMLNKKLKDAFLVFFSMFILIPPSSFYGMPQTIVTIWRLFQGVFFGVYFIIYVTTYKKIHSVVIIAIAFFISSYGISSYVNGVIPSIVSPIVSLAVCFMILVYLKINEESLYKGISVYFIFIIILQIVLCLFSPSSFIGGNYGLFGNKNFITKFFIAGPCFATLYCSKKYNRNYSFFNIIAIAFTGWVILTSESATGIICYIAMILLMIFFRKHDYPKWMSVFCCAIYSIILFLLIYYCRIQDKFEFIIVTLLHKRLDFTGRSLAWDKAIPLIKANPWLGIGCISDMSNLIIYRHCHQYWLQTALCGGVVGVILTLMMYFCASKNLKNKQNDKGAKMLTTTIICYLIIGIDETLTNADMLIGVLALASVYRNARARKVVDK